MAKTIKNSPIIRYGVLAIAAILWFVVIWDPLSARIEETETLTRDGERKANRLAIEIEEKKGLEQAERRIRQQVDAARKALVPGDTPQAVASSLQDLALKKASSAGLQIITYKTTPPRKWNSHQLSGVTLTVKTSTQGLVAFLKELEQEQGLFRIETLNVTKVQGRDTHLRATITLEALSLEGVQAG